MKKIILVDNDGTMVKGSIVLEHYGFLVTKGMGDKNLYNSWLADVKNEKLIVEVATDYQRIITGKTLKEIFVNDFINEYVKGDIFTPAYHLIKHKTTTEKMIVSGSPQFLIEPFAKLLGQDWTPNGSIYEFENEKLTGKILVPMFLASEKIKVVNEVIENDYIISYGIGDTASDFPLLSQAEIKILVKPTQHTLDIFSDFKDLIVINN